MQLPEEFVVRREIGAIQHFGQSLLEPIPSGEVILVERVSLYARMIEVVWQERRYLVFDRDLTDVRNPSGSPQTKIPPSGFGFSSEGSHPKPTCFLLKDHQFNFGTRPA